MVLVLLEVEEMKVVREGVGFLEDNEQRKERN